MGIRSLAGCVATCTAVFAVLALAACAPEAKGPAARPSTPHTTDTRPITLASLPGATPYPDFATDGHVTIDIRHAAVACDQYPTTRCSDATHWPIELNGTHYDNTVAGEAALVAALTAGVLPHRPATRPATPPPTRRVLIAVDRNAPCRAANQALALCFDVRHSLYLDLGVGTLDISYQVTDPADPATAARLDSPMGWDWSDSPRGCGPNDEIRILMAFNDDTHVLQRLSGMRSIPDGATGSAQLAKILREQTDSFVGMGKRVPIVLDASGSVLWQDVIDIAAMCTPLKTAGITIAGPGFQPGSLPVPEDPPPIDPQFAPSGK